jgi:hypothetical protein
LVEEGVTFQGLDEKGKLSVEERKKFTPTDKKAYKKHHNVNTTPFLTLGNDTIGNG